MRYRKAADILLALLGIGVAALVVSALRQAMAAGGPATVAERFPANTWVELKPKIVLRPDMEFSPRWFGANQGFSNGAGYNGAAYRPKSGEALFISYWTGKVKGDWAENDWLLGGGIYQNCLYALDPVAQMKRQIEVSRWRRKGKDEDPKGARVVIDWLEHPSGKDYPTPVPRHPYRGVAYAPTTDTLYLYRGASIGQGPPNTLWGYSFERGKWEKVLADEKRAGGILPPHREQFETCMTWHPAAEQGHPGYLLFFAEGRLPPYKIDLKTLKCEPASSEYCGGGYLTGRCVDTKRNTVWFCGGEGETKKTPERTNVWGFDVAAGKPVALRSKTALWPPARTCPGMAYLPKEDMLCLLGGHGSANDQWVYDFRTEQWVRLPDVPFKVSGTPYRVWHYLEYDTKNGLLLLCSQPLNEGWYALRFVPGELAELKELTSPSGALRPVE